jgi:hypothetical protein
VKEERERREWNQLGQLRRDYAHRVGDAQARSHRLGNLVERIDFAVGEGNVFEHRWSGFRRRGRQRKSRHVDLQLLDFGT